jgi:hypothetical protein
MRANVIIIVEAPMFDKESGLGGGSKPVLVKAAVAESAIEAFNKSVLHGFLRLDVIKGDPRRLSLEGFAGQLRAIVQSDDLWQGTGESEFLKGGPHGNGK